MLLRLNLFLNVLNSTDATLLESLKDFKVGRKGVVDRTIHYNFYFEKGNKMKTIQTTFCNFTLADLMFFPIVFL